MDDYEHRLLLLEKHMMRLDEDNAHIFSISMSALALSVLVLAAFVLLLCLIRCPKREMVQRANVHVAAERAVDENRAL